MTEQSEDYKRGWVDSRRDLFYVRGEPYSGNLPERFPIEVNAAGQGPARPDEVHHRVCWCAVPDCYWTRALAAEREGATTRR